MKHELSLLEARVIGCLIEKAITTPDYYPLTLNSLTSACNQKSSREPVLSLTESEVQNTVDALIAQRLVSDESAFNSRTAKYQHRFCNTEFGDLTLNEQELGLICCLLLRGAQTPGELRTRTQRLCQFTDVRETEQVLEQLVERELVAKLAREPGKREVRYQQLFSPFELCDEPVTNVESESISVSDLAQEVADLKQEVAELKAALMQLGAEFDT